MLFFLFVIFFPFLVDNALFLGLLVGSFFSIWHLRKLCTGIWNSEINYVKMGIGQKPPLAVFRFENFETLKTVIAGLKI